MVVRFHHDGPADPSIATVPAGGTRPRTTVTAIFKQPAAQTVQKIRMLLRERQDDLVAKQPKGPIPNAHGHPKALRAHYPGADRLQLAIAGVDELLEVPADPREGVSGVFYLDIFPALVRVLGQARARQIYGHHGEGLEGRRYALIPTENGERRVDSDPFAWSVGAKGASGTKPYYSRFEGILGKKHVPPRKFFRAQPRGQPGFLRPGPIYETSVGMLAADTEGASLPENQAGTIDAVLAAGPIRRHVARLVGTGGFQLELMPVNDHEQPGAGNWGYYNSGFFTVEQRFAAGRNAANRKLGELAKFVSDGGGTLGIDVVYNHGGQLLEHTIGDRARRPHNGSGCGLELRSETPYVQQYLLEAVRHFVKRHGIGLFRFDLAPLLHKEFLFRLDRELPPSVQLIAEPHGFRTLWNVGDHAGEFANTRWKFWNGYAQETLCRFIGAWGLSDHEHGDPHTGDTDTKRLWRAMRGQLFSPGVAAGPAQSVNYLTCHDNWTLRDRLWLKGIHDTTEIKRRVGHGITWLMATPGTPMIEAGTECLRSNDLIRNPYNRFDLNRILWRDVVAHRDLVDFVLGLGQTWQRLPHFHGYRQRTRAEGREIGRLQIQGDPQKALGVLLNAPRTTTRQHDAPLIVLGNGSHAPRNAPWAEAQLPDGDWCVVADTDMLGTGRPALDMRGLRDTDGSRRIASGTYGIPPGGAAILYPAHAATPPQ